MFISTHALTWSATYLPRRFVAHIAISTHALTWSATGGSININTNAENFNSRAHVERDVNSIRESLEAFNFNSRAHVERDVMNTDYQPLCCISTHALTWSATAVNCHIYKGIVNFNSRAHVERDPRCCCSWTLAPHDTDPILFGLQNIGAMFINR